MHLTVCVSMIPSVGVERRPAARRRRTATSRIRRSNRPSESQRRNQPYTVRHGGRCDGKARHGPPTRRCQAIARTTASVGVAASLRGGSARSSHRATFFSAHCDTISFKRGSCRARCSFVHIQSHRPIRRTSSSIIENKMGIEEHNCTQTGSKADATPKMDGDILRMLFVLHIFFYFYFARRRACVLFMLIRILISTVEFDIGA